MSTLDRETFERMLSAVEDAAMEYQQAKAWGGTKFDSGAEGRALEAAKAALLTYAFGEECEAGAADEEAHFGPYRVVEGASGYMNRRGYGPV